MTDVNIEVYRLRSTGIVIDSDGGDLGRIVEVYLDDAGQPEWVSVRPDAFAGRSFFLPLVDADVDGDEVRVPYSPDTIRSAPQVDAEAVLTPADEDALRRHYATPGGR